MKEPELPQWRFMLWHESINRLEMRGTFTANDLRLLADWLDSEDHPTNRAWQLVLRDNLSLSPIVPE